MICIVFIHNDIRSITIRGESVRIPNDIGVLYEFSNVITMLAVPLYFLFAGYFAFFKSESYVTLLKKKIKQIGIPYVLWCLIFIGVYYTTQLIPSMRTFFSQSYNNIRSFSYFDWFDAFWGKFTRPNPIVPQFWFLRDLLILILISPALKNLLDTIPVFTMSCASLFFICSIDIYLVRADALFFFSLGYIIFKRDIDFDLVDTIKYIDVLLPYTVGAFLQIFFPYFTYVISAFYYSFRLCSSY